jgi:SAM-dependent methyltransferase
MHDSALFSGKYFINSYVLPEFHVVDIGGADLNGSIKGYFNGIYTVVDIEPHPSVDIVIKPGDPLPFETGSVDIIVSTSCFEHDPCFWLTFKEMARIVKIGGYIYINAPSNGYYHGHPGDNWRFYADAGQALAYWASKEKYPVSVEETFFINPLNDYEPWIDFICVWKRTTIIETSILVSDNIKNKIGPLKQKLINHGFKLN